MAGEVGSQLFSITFCRGQVTNLMTVYSDTRRSKENKSVQTVKLEKCLDDCYYTNCSSSYPLCQYPVWLYFLPLQHFHAQHISYILLMNWTYLSAHRCPGHSGQVICSPRFNPALFQSSVWWQQHQVSQNWVWCSDLRVRACVCVSFPSPSRSWLSYTENKNVT